MHLPVIAQRVNDLPAGMSPQIKTQCSLCTLGATILYIGKTANATAERDARARPHTGTGPAHRGEQPECGTARRERVSRRRRGLASGAACADFAQWGAQGHAHTRRGDEPLTEVGCADAAAALQSPMLSRGAMRGGWDPDFRDRYQGMYWVRPRRTYLRLHITL